MNYRIVAFLLGELCRTLGIALCVPFILALLWGDPCRVAFAETIALTAVVSYLLIKYGKADSKDNITFREGVAVVSGAWVLLTFLGGLPYYFGNILDLVSAVFESISGFTTTGATTITQIVAVPKSMLFWRSMTHWMGGIGIVVWFIALLPNLGTGVVHMYNAEVTGATDDRVLPRIKTTSVALCKIYVGLTTILAILLFGAGMNVFDSITHAFSTIATGGFSSYDTSIVYFKSPLIEMIIAVFMILAGGNFALYFSVGSKGIKELWHDTEFFSYIAIVVVVTLLITGNLAAKTGMGLVEAARYAFFQVASIISTTGFVSNDFDVWPPFSKYMLVMLMFIGACAGSTAGGIKVSRIVILFKTAVAEIKRVLHPSAIFSVKMSGKSVPLSVITGISRFFFLYMLLFAILTLLLASTGLTVTDSMGAIAATISSVGPALGIAGATCTYAPIAPFGKIVICLAMLLGRLELFTLMVLIRPEFWRSTRNW